MSCFLGSGIPRTELTSEGGQQHSFYPGGKQGGPDQQQEGAAGHSQQQGRAVEGKTRECERTSDIR